MDYCSVNNHYPTLPTVSGVYVSIPFVWALPMELALASGI